MRLALEDRNARGSSVEARPAANAPPATSSQLVRVQMHLEVEPQHRRSGQGKVTSASPSQSA